MTLIELMVALALNMLMLGVLFALYVASLQSFHMQMAFTDIEHHASTAIDVLRTEIQKAGHIGCARLTKSFPLFSSAEDRISSENALVGAEHEITVRYMDFMGVSTVGPIIESRTIWASTEVRYQSGDKLVLSNCNNAEIFTVKAVYQQPHMQKIVAARPFQGEFAAGAEVGELTVKRLYVSDTGRRFFNGERVFALWAEDVHHQRSELVEGIHQIGFDYSIFQNGKLLDLPAHRINDWAFVAGVAAKLELHVPPLSKEWYAYVAR